MRFRLFRYPVEIQTSVLVIAGVYLLFGLQAQDPIAETLLRVLVIFGSILVHELGHAVAATLFGLQPIAITLHGFGGVTSHRRADHPWKELVVTLAGPSAGLSLAVLAFVAALLAFPGLAGEIIEYVFAVNLFWSLFNLLPLYPMDGGQALASFLKLFAPGIAYPVTFGLGLVGGAAMGVLALWASLQGYAGTILLLFFAGLLVSQNLSMLQAWRRAVRGEDEPDEPQAT